MSCCQGARWACCWRRQVRCMVLRATDRATPLLRSTGRLVVRPVTCMLPDLTAHLHVGGVDLAAGHNSQPTMACRNESRDCSSVALWNVRRYLASLSRIALIGADMGGFKGLRNASSGVNHVLCVAPTPTPQVCVATAAPGCRLGCKTWSVLLESLVHVPESLSESRLVPLGSIGTPDTIQEPLPASASVENTRC